eukprot:gene28132-biopygen32083
MFRVRWNDPYTAEDDTWEPVDDLLDLQVFAAFMRSDTWVAFVKENADAVKGFAITNAFERAMAYIDVAVQLLDLTVPGSFNYDALLTQSVIGGHTDLVRAIVQTPRFAAGTIPNSGDSELLIEAAENGHTEIVRLLLEAPVNPAHANCQGGRALVPAAAGGHTEIVRLLLESPQHAARADCQRGLALVEAAEGGHMEVARLLLSAPIHPARADCPDVLALIEAARGGHTEVAKFLIGYPEHAARADGQRGRALVLAAEGGHIETVRFLLSAPIHPARADCLDGLALIEAARGGHIEVAKLLIGYPDHPAHADCQRGRALASAAGGGHIETVRLLMEAPAHPARADYQMDGALLRAAEGGHTEVVRLLLSAPVHPTHADCLGGAALMEAVRRQRGRALALARQGGHVEVAKLLLRFGGNMPKSSYVNLTSYISSSSEDQDEEDEVDVVEDEVEVVEDEVEVVENEVEAMSESESDDEAQAMSESESDAQAQAQAMSESDDEPEPEPEAQPDIYQPAHTFEDRMMIMRLHPDKANSLRDTRKTKDDHRWMDKLSQNLNGAFDELIPEIPCTTINIMGSVPYHGIPTEMDVINDNLVIECMGLAIRRNRPDIVRSFLITGGPVRLRRNLFDDPFMIACKFGYAEVVQILLDANAIDRTGYADDHYDKAFAHGHITIMHMLFERGLTSFDACTMANMAFSVLFRDKPFEIGQDEEGIMRAAAHVVSGCNCNVCMSTKNLQSQMHALARHLM